MPQSKEEKNEYNRQRYLKKKEEILQRQKAYNLKNKEKIKKQQKEKYYKNKDKILQQHKEYYLNNKEKMKQKQKEHYLKDRDKILQKNKEYNIKNSDKIKEYNTEYRKTEVGKKTYRISCWKQQGILCFNYNLLYDIFLSTNRCEYCNVNFTEDHSASSRCLDHDHSITDKFNIRGVLCRKCNSADVLKFNPLI